MTTEEIRKRLFEMQDLPYRQFQSNLTPTVPPENMIGVRTPQLRSFAKELFREGDCEAFLRELPHRYFEENNLHGFLICLIGDYDRCLEQLDRFLPYVDNWATCDQLRPMVFKKHKDRLIGDIRRWISSGETYTVRFGLEMLMTWFLDEDFRPEYLDLAAGLRSDEYYVNMMIAWFFATALAKQYTQTVPFLERRRLEDWTHRKSIQKACESYRISPEQKQYLRSLK